MGNDVIALLLSVVAWFIGESGRIFLVAGSGGLVRWITSETKSLRDAFASIIGAYFIGGFLWPLTLHLPTFFKFPEIVATADNVYAAAFLTGTIGASIVKLGITFVEVYGIHWISRYKNKG